MNTHIDLKRVAERISQCLALGDSENPREAETARRLPQTNPRKIKPKKTLGFGVRVFYGVFYRLAQTIPAGKHYSQSNPGENSMNRKFLLIALWLGCPFAASADRDAERTALAKIKHEIESLKPLIEEAKAQADRDARVQFQYDWLALDLNRISLGIQEHLSAPSTQPRSFPPLKGDYRQ